MRMTSIQFIFLNFFFLMRTILKIFIKFVITLLLLYVLVYLVLRHVQSQLSDHGLNPHAQHWKVKSNYWIAREVPTIQFRRAVVST